MKWLLVFTVVCSTVLSDLLQSWEMKRQGEIRDFRPARIGGLLARVLRRTPMLLAIAAMAVSFFAFLQLLKVADLSFAVPATAASLVLETMLARLVLNEKVHTRRWAGVCMVALGVALLARG